MDLAAAQNASTPAQTETIGRVAAVTGAQATIELNARAGVGEVPTVGKFMGLIVAEGGDHRHDHRGRRAGADGGRGRDARLPQGGAHRSDRRTARRRQRRHAFPARRHRISQYRRRRAALVGSRAAHGLRARRRRPRPYRRPAAEPEHPGARRHRQSGQPALRHPRRHRRRQVERRRHHPAEDSRHAAEPAHLPGRSAQRIRPLLRRQGAGAHAAQPAAAVLAVQFRGDHRRLLRRPSGRRRRDRDPLRSHPARQGGLSAIPRRHRRARSPSGAIRATPASPPTRRCPTASRT